MRQTIKTKRNNFVALSEGLTVVLKHIPVNTGPTCTIQICNLNLAYILKVHLECRGLTSSVVCPVQIKTLRSLELLRPQGPDRVLTYFKMQSDIHYLRSLRVTMAHRVVILINAP